MDIVSQYEEIILPLSKIKVRCRDCKNWKYNSEGGRYKTYLSTDECSPANPGFGGYVEQDEKEIRFLLATGQEKKIRRRNTDLLDRKKTFITRRFTEAGRNVPTSSYHRIDARPSVLNYDNRCICFVGTRKYLIKHILTSPFWGPVYVFRMVRDYITVLRTTRKK